MKRGEISKWLLCLLLAWFLAATAILLITGSQGTALFGLSFVLVYGGVVYLCHHRIRDWLRRLPGPAAGKFFTLAFCVSAAEEIYCYLSGNHLALPVLWADVLFCSLTWLAWYGTWYFFLSKRYRFGETEALLTAGAIGLLYEGVSSGAILANPAGVLLLAPLPVLVYATLFLLPMQLIDFTGQRENIWKYPVSVVGPYLLSLPIALTLYFFFGLIGLPLR